MTKQHLTESFLIKLKAAIDADPQLTPAGLSKRAGLADSAIRLMFLRGNQSPSLSTAERICEAMGTNLIEFMSDAETKEEREIVRLIAKLPLHLRQQLLGYGQALADAADQPPSTQDATDRSAKDRNS
jgi:transcriptional regulator with XRE-family HTH domain